MTRITNTNTLPRLAQTCLAAFVALMSASAVLAQGEAADPSSEQATGGACTAQASLGELSLSGPSVTTDPLTDANPGTAETDAGLPSSASVSTSAPTAGGPESGGFVSLASGSADSATECTAVGSALASTQVLPASLADTSSTAVAEPPAEAQSALASAAGVSAPVQQSVPVKKKKKAVAPPSQSASREASQVWWPAPESGRLNLRFAGEAAFGQAIALLFDAPFADPASADAHVQVLNRTGTVLKGKWQVVKSNPQMLALKAAPGTYTIRIGSDLVASNGLRFKLAAQGKVQVR